MIDVERVRGWSWWDSEDWTSYCEAYGSLPGRPVEDGSYVVDLTVENLWAKVSKGHKAAIRQETQRDVVHTCRNVEAYHRLHAAQAGRETRSQATWDFMQAWVDDYKAVLVTNGHSAWAFVILDPPGAYYASGAGKDGHHLQWKLICGLQHAGFGWYELGEGHTPGIRTFKAGFGGELIGASSEVLA